MKSIGKLSTLLILGMRLHSIIYAAASAVPCIGIAYETKVSGFLEYIGQPYVLPIDGLDAVTIERSVTEVWEKRKTIVRRLSERSAQMRKKAGEAERLAAELMMG